MLLVDVARDYLQELVQHLMLSPIVPMLMSRQMSPRCRCYMLHLSS